MKKVISILLFLIISDQLLAQKFFLGTEVGSISSINASYGYDNIDNRRNTYYIGLNTNYRFNPTFEFTSGIHYLRQGIRHGTCFSTAPDVKNEVVRNLDYIIIPISLKTYIDNSKKLFITTGLFGGINIKAHQDVPESIGGCELGYIRNLSPSTSKVLFGAIAGLGYTFYQNKKMTIQTTTKYYQGISNIKTSPSGSFVNWSDRYGAILLTLGMNYKL